MAVPVAPPTRPPVTDAGKGSKHQIVKAPTPTASTGGGGTPAPPANYGYVS